MAEVLEMKCEVERIEGVEVIRMPRPLDLEDDIKDMDFSRSLFETATDFIIRGFSKSARHVYLDQYDKASLLCNGDRFSALLPSLSCLHVSLDNSPQWPLGVDGITGAVVLPGNIFHSTLTHLNIEDNTSVPMELPSALLAASQVNFVIQAPMLTSIDIDVACMAQKWPGYIRAIPPHIEEIVMNGIGTKHYSNPLIACLTSHIESVGGEFPRLTSIEICDYGFHFDDDDGEDMPSTRGTLQMATIVALIARCPRLKLLKFPNVVLEGVDTGLAHLVPSRVTIFIGGSEMIRTR
jgi:hypothetical protein